MIARYLSHLFFSLTPRFMLPPTERVTCLRFTKVVTIDGNTSPAPLLLVGVNVASEDIDSAVTYGKLYVFSLEFLNHINPSVQLSLIDMKPWWVKEFEGSISTFEMMSKDRQHLLVIALMASRQDLAGWSCLMMVDIRGQRVLSGQNQTYDLAYYVSSLTTFKNSVLVGNLKMGLTFLIWVVRNEIG